MNDQNRFPITTSISLLSAQGSLVGWRGLDGREPGEQISCPGGEVLAGIQLKRAQRTAPEATIQHYQRGQTRFNLHLDIFINSLFFFLQTLNISCWQVPPSDPVNRPGGTAEYALAGGSPRSLRPRHESSRQIPHNGGSSPINLFLPFTSLPRARRHLSRLAPLAKEPLTLSSTTLADVQR